MNSSLTGQIDANSIHSPHSSQTWVLPPWVPFSTFESMTEGSIRLLDFHAIRIYRTTIICGAQNAPANVSRAASHFAVTCV